MEKITRKQYAKLKKRRLDHNSVPHSAYDLNEVGGVAHDRKVK